MVILHMPQWDIQKSKEIERIAQEENLPIRIVEMDVDNDNSVKTTIEKIISERNRIHILVNNAGYGLFGALEDLPMEEIKRQYETNVFGVIRVSQNVLPIMRSQRDGIIINISSVSGLWKPIGAYFRVDLSACKQQN